jgi:hypothetical protein
VSDEAPRPWDLLELDETEILSLKGLDERYFGLALSNRQAAAIDEDRLGEQLGRLSGIDRMKSLTVRPSSMVKNLRFLKAMQGLENLSLHGLQLRTLDGVESFTGRYLEIDTGKNKKRDIHKLSSANIAQLVLRWATRADTQAIASSSTIRHLILRNCPELSFDALRGTRLEILQLFSGTIQQISDAARIPSLTQLTTQQCRNLERFSGDNSNLTWMVVQVCKQVDWGSIGTCKNLEHLVAIKSAKAKLSAFGQLKRLRNLSVVDGDIDLDAPALKQSAKSLEKLVIAPLAKDKVIELSTFNPDVIVSNTRMAYKNGKPTDVPPS